MKKAAVLILFILGLSSASAQSIQDFRDVADFSVTLENLEAFALETLHGDAEADKFIILNGAVASITPIDPSEESFVAVIELVGGDWVGLERVEIYKCFLQVEGPDFFTRLPRRAPSNPGPEIIQINQEVMVLGKVIDLLPLDQENVVPLVYAYSVRAIE
jgi:hypothetical protein